MLSTNKRSSSKVKAAPQLAFKGRMGLNRGRDLE
jgi:hypothetical protein